MSILQISQRSYPPVQPARAKATEETPASLIQQGTSEPSSTSHAAMWPGKSQVKFSGLDNQIQKKLQENKEDYLELLSRPYYTPSFEEKRGGEILAYMARHAREADHRRSEKYITKYFDLLENIGFKADNPKQANEARNAFLVPFLIKGLMECDDNNIFQNLHLTPLGLSVAKLWDQEGAAYLKSKQEKKEDPGIIYTLDSEKFTNIYDVISFLEPSGPDLDLIKQQVESAEVAGAETQGQIAKAWLKTITNYPWKLETVDHSDYAKTRELFQESIYGLETVKKRLLEVVAMRMRSNNTQGGIIVLYGPPGIGKTLSGEVLAQGLGRKFVKRSLASISDATEISGGLRVWIGAKYGLPIAGMIEAQSRNPVFFLDEFDKMSARTSTGSNPMNALTNVLDPDQNHFYKDNYMELPVDFSKVLFIITVNSFENIPPHLVSRMEIIEFPGYFNKEKLEIAQRFIIPEVLKKYGISPEEIRFESEALLHIIDTYTREAGVRKLKEKIGTIARNCGKELLDNPEQMLIVVNKEKVDQILTNPMPIENVAKRPPITGEAHGLYYNLNGGGVLSIQVGLVPGTGKIQLTGSLGDVMKESAQTAISMLQTIDAKKFGLNEEKIQEFKNKKLDIHVHYPEGGVKKDGPSAGISTTLALWSEFSGMPVPRSLAMTGEVDLKGRVTSIGGVKEKVTGGIAQGITHFILPKGNEADFKQLYDSSTLFREEIEGVPFHFVDTVEQALEVVQKISKEEQPDS